MYGAAHQLPAAPVPQKRGANIKVKPTKPAGRLRSRQRRSSVHLIPFVLLMRGQIKHDNIGPGRGRLMILGPGGRMPCLHAKVTVAAAAHYPVGLRHWHVSFLSASPSPLLPLNKERDPFPSVLQVTARAELGKTRTGQPCIGLLSRWSRSPDTHAPCRRQLGGDSVDTDAGGLFSPAVCTMAEGWPGLAEPGRLM